MSHTSYYEIPGFGEVTVIHDSGWDGEAKIRWTNPANGRDRYEAAIPAPLLLALGGKVALDHVRSETIGFLEQLGAPDREGPRLDVPGMGPVEDAD